MASPVDTIEPCQVTELNNLTANHLFGPLQILEMTVAGGVASMPRQPYYSYSFAPAGQRQFPALSSPSQNLHLAHTVHDDSSIAGQRAVGDRGPGGVRRAVRHTGRQGAVPGCAGYGRC
jgi:hypothetical protein